VTSLVDQTRCIRNTLTVMNPTKIFIALTLLIVNLGAAAGAGAVPLNHPRCSGNAECKGGSVCCPLRGVSTRLCDVSCWIGTKNHLGWRKVWTAVVVREIVGLCPG